MVWWGGTCPECPLRGSAHDLNSQEKFKIDDMRLKLVLSIYFALQNQA